jgi:hypothetical protein
LLGRHENVNGTRWISPRGTLLDRAIGNIVLTVSRALPAGVPNNINAH